jgi:hypothetical protein
VEGSGAEAGAEAGAWRDVGPWREPYALEGAKTLGYELAEQFNWEPPDAIVCPCGSGLGLVALWKAFTELRELGWTAGRLPKLVGVTLEGPGSRVAGFAPPALALFPELAQGTPEAEELVRCALEETGGARIEVGAAELAEIALKMASREGILPSLEGAACIQAVTHAIRQGILGREDRIVVVNPVAGLRRLDLYLRRVDVPESGQAARQGRLDHPALRGRARTIVSTPCSRTFYGNRPVAEALYQPCSRGACRKPCCWPGPQGVGKATLARRLAAALLGEAEKIERDDLSLPENQAYIREREKWPAERRNEDPLIFASHPDFVTFAPDGPAAPRSPFNKCGCSRKWRSTSPCEAAVGCS